jgi:diphthamide synthase (EF-2-diphthine--ammonia ligase)
MIMSQLVLESENEQNLKLIQELAEKLDIRCRFILQTTKPKKSKQDEINEAIEFVKSFSQETTSFGDPLVWQQAERQEQSLD